MDYSKDEIVALYRRAGNKIKQIKTTRSLETATALLYASGG